LTIALYHFHVTQIGRSAGQSAVAAAAYRAGEKLHSLYYGEDADYTRKGGVICSEILLPDHAPPEYANRETLWNAIENVERHPKAQLAYSFDIALQNEFSMEENIALARHFLLEEFVSRGMIVDFAVHQPDKEGGIPNPHFHVLCPIRPLNPDGTWGAKQHREYVLDEHGERVKDDAGHAVFNAVPTTDWGRPETLEHWRQAWADLCNAKFAEKKITSHIDHRSYERQGVDQLPTIHEGVAVRQMEAKGIRTDKGDLNRWIKATNQLIRKVKAKLKELGGLLKEYKPQVSDLAQLLGEYYDIRNAGAYSTKAKEWNLKRYAEDFSFLQERNIGSVEQLQSYVSEVSAQVHDLNAEIRSKSSRMKDLNRLIRLAEDYARLKPVVDGVPPKGGFGKKREKYLAAHNSEIRQYYAVKRKLDSALPDKKLAPKGWQEELNRLSEAYAEDSQKLKPIYADLKKLREIQAKINTAAHDQTHGRDYKKDRGAEL
jgi:hypothetical protein